MAEEIVFNDKTLDIFLFVVSIMEHGFVFINLKMNNFGVESKSSPVQKLLDKTHTKFGRLPFPAKYLQITSRSS